MDRWFSLSTGLLLEAASGTPYLFGVYSESLKRDLNFTQADINVVGSIGSIGQSFAFFGGFVYDRMGPLATGWSGAGIALLGYLLMYYGAQKAISHTVTAMAVYSFLWGNGCSWGDVTAIATQSGNFPDDRGKVLGVMKSFYGLSASLFALVYAGFYRPNVPPLLLFLTIASPIGITLATLGQRRVGGDARKSRPLGAAGCCRLGAYVAVILSVLVYVVSISALEGTGHITASPALAWILIPLLSLVFLPYLPFPCFREPEEEAEEDEPEEELQRHIWGLKPEALPINDDPYRSALIPADAVLSATSSHDPFVASDALSSGRGSSLSNGTDSLVGAYRHGNRSSGGSLLSSDNATSFGGSLLSSSATTFLLSNGVNGTPPKGGAWSPLEEESGRSDASDEDHPSSFQRPNLSLGESLCSLEFYLLCACIMIGAGAGATVTTNVGQMLKAIDPEATNQSSYVVFFSAGNSLGRMFFGMGSDMLRRWVSRPMWLTFAVLSMGGAMMVCAFATESSLYVACAWTGFSLGGFVALAPILTGDLFGNKAFGTVFTIANFTGAFGNLGFSTGLASAVYQANTTEEMGNTCVGPACFQLTFLILAGACALTSAAAILMTARTWTLYRRMQANKEWREKTGFTPLDEGGH